MHSIIIMTARIGTGPASKIKALYNFSCVNEYLATRHFKEINLSKAATGN